MYEESSQCAVVFSNCFFTQSTDLNPQCPVRCRQFWEITRIYLKMGSVAGIGRLRYLRLFPVWISDRMAVDVIPAYIHKYKHLILHCNCINSEIFRLTPGHAQTSNPNNNEVSHDSIQSRKYLERLPQDPFEKKYTIRSYQSVIDRLCQGSGFSEPLYLWQRALHQADPLWVFALIPAKWATAWTKARRFFSHYRLSAEE